MTAQNNYFWTAATAEGTKVGLNDQGRDDLGEVSFIDLPAVGTVLKTNGKFLSVDSPVSGTIVAVNEKLADQPEDLSSNDQGKNWIVVVK